jgi:iron complex transport system substrate-binding protein
MATPQRIASLLSSATEMLYGVGLGDRVVAVSHECDYPAEVAAKPRATFSRIDSAANSRAIDDQVRSLVNRGEALYGIDTGLLETLAPDLIVTQAQCDVCAVRYEDVVSAVTQSPKLYGRPVLALNPSSLADVLADIRRVAEAAGVPAAGEHYVAQLQARVTAVRQRTARIPAALRPRVACIEWIDPPFLAANWMPQLIGWAGGDDGGLTRQGEHSIAVRWEDVAAFDPQVIVVLPCGFDLPRTVAEARRLPGFAGWQALTAVRTGRVYAADGNAYFNRSGPRLVESLEILAHLFHPERHPAPTGLDSQRAWQKI